jgi:hypothetical protein
MCTCVGYCLLLHSFYNVPMPGRRDIANYKNAQSFPDVAILRFDADLYFANSGSLCSRSTRAVHSYCSWAYTFLRWWHMLCAALADTFRDAIMSKAASNSAVVLDASIITAIDTQVRSCVSRPEFLVHHCSVLCRRMFADHRTWRGPAAGVFLFTGPAHVPSNCAGREGPGQAASAGPGPPRGVPAAGSRSHPGSLGVREYGLCVQCVQCVQLASRSDEHRPLSVSNGCAPV